MANPLRPLSVPARTAGLLLSVGLVGALLGACSDSSRPTVRDANAALETILAAGAEAPGYTVQGTMRTADGAQQKVSGTSSPQVVTQGSGELRGAVLTGAELRPVHLLWSDASLFVEREVVAQPGAGVAGLLTRTAADPPWMKVPAGPLVAPWYQASVPAEVLDVFERTDPAVRTIDGDGLHVRTEEPVNLAGFAEAAVDLYADADGALQRIAVRSATASLDYTVRVGPVDAPTLPRGDDVASAGGAAPKPTGPLRSVARGTTEGVAWVLRQGPGTAGTTCWKVETTPALTLLPPEVRCAVPAAADDPLADQVLVLAASSAQAPRSLVVLRTPQRPASGRVGFVGGTFEDLPAAGLTDPVVFVGPRSPLPGLVELTYPGGEVVACGAAAVSEPADLGDSTLTETVGQSPWICDAAE